MLKSVSVVYDGEDDDEEEEGGDVGVSTRESVSVGPRALQAYQFRSPATCDLNEKSTGTQPASSAVK